MAERKNIQVTYNSEINTVYFDTEKEKFIPGYLKYLLEYLKIPADTALIFKGSNKAYTLTKRSNNHDN